MSKSTFPEAVVKTTFGPLRVWSTSEEHVGVTTAWAHEDQPDVSEHITVNRVDYTLRMDLHPVASFDENKRRHVVREQNGWGITYDADIMRRDNYDGPSQSARDKVRDVIFPEIVAWLETGDGRALLREAGTFKREQEHKSAAEAVDKARAELAAAEARLAAFCAQS